jgi:hypothetical protein
MKGAAQVPHRRTGRAREFGELCELYAHALQDPGSGESAETLRVMVRGKLAEIREALADGEDSRSRKSAA